MGLAKEIWKPVKGYEGLYIVSNCGKVVALSKSWICGDKNITRNKDQVELTPIFDNKKYLQVTLSKNRISRTIKVHRLVWEAFGNKPRAGFDIDHIDNNPLNNNINNLQLLSHRQNTTKAKLREDLPTGVYRDNRLQSVRYYSRIQINGKNHYLGKFITIQDAEKAYQNALKQAV